MEEQNQPQQQPEQQPAAPPKNWLVESILVTIFCCWPLGIPAIIFAARVNSKFNQGDYLGAQEAADKAKKFTLIALALGLIVIVGYIILMFAGVLGGAMYDFQ